MSTKIRIHVTKEILDRSCLCGVAYLDINGCVGEIQTVTNCAFALAVRDVFPNAMVSSNYIMPFGVAHDDINCVDLYEMAKRGKSSEKDGMFVISEEMENFIIKFDDATPRERMAMPEQSFELDVPDWVVDKTGQGEVDFVTLIANSPVLELV